MNNKTYFIKTITKWFIFIGILWHVWFIWMFIFPHNVEIPMRNDVNLSIECWSACGNANPLWKYVVDWSDVKCEYSGCGYCECKCFEFIP